MSGGPPHGAACDLPDPGAAEDFEVREVTHEEVPVWYHVYCTRSHPSTTAQTFTEGWGDTRFAPIDQADDTPVHTYYVASSPEAAYMESVLHDVSLSPPGLFEVASLAHFHLVKLKLPPVLRYVSFHTPYLPRLQKISRAQLIDSLPGCYPQTRRWSQAAYLQRPAAQAIGYGSKRHDAARCLMLFGQRLPEPPFEVLNEEPLAVGARRAELLALVRSLKLHEV
ncbi:RES family NAD+ phosphorylase [Variovorax sp. LjRoot290]|uniref:RES family NAD+ phosphorylase n=1 Tax=unclassified Variovorax TaxID=663243 RepID=UPI003ED04A25